MAGESPMVVHEHDYTKVTFAEAGLVVTLHPHVSGDVHRYVNVTSPLTHAADPELVKLEAQVAALGDLRWCTRVEYGGTHPEVDALYDELNRHTLAAFQTVAAQVVRLLADAGLVSGDVDRAISGAYGSANAGCEMCSCSPGATLGATLYADERAVNIYVDLNKDGEL